MPGGVSSPVRSFKGMDVEPIMIERGYGARLVDISGKEYTDFCMSWGALIHGHSDPVINQKIIEAVQKGTSYGLTSPLEVELAERLVEALPGVDKVRFVSSGTESCMSAIRLARGVTGRRYIVKFDGHYHGHSDSFLVNAGSCVKQDKMQPASRGVTKAMASETISIPFNDISALKKVFDDPALSHEIAAVILEVVPGNMGVVLPDREFLRVLQSRVKVSKALLIADEVITGFRSHYGGVYQVFGLEPDLVCLGKIIGGGMPCAAFGGRKEIMDQLSPGGTIFQAGTLSGNPVAVAAGIAALEKAKDPGFYTLISGKVTWIVEQLKIAIKDLNLPIQVQSIGPMFTLFFGSKEPVTNFEQTKHCDHATFKAYFKHMLEAGIYVSPSQYEALFISSKHQDEDIRHFVDASCAFFKTLAEVASA